MNIFEKIKLRSMLRNCDYELAGTVLKQQYYDESKNTELNRLIDEYLQDPCFDNAVKIIKYNDMFIFYFTESCHGGLYVRKNHPHEEATLDSQPPAPPLPTDRALPIKDAAETGSTSSNQYDAQAEFSANKDMPKEKLDTSKSIEFKRTETADELIEKARQTVAKKLAEIEKKIVSPTSETRPLERDKGKKAEEPIGSIVKTEDSSIHKSEKFNEASDTGITASELSSLRQEPSTPKVESKPEPKPKEQLKSTVAKTSQASSVVFPDPEPVAAPVTSEPKQEFLNPVQLEAAAAMETPIDLLTLNPQETKFPNVISTLLIDVQDLARQMEEYRAAMFQKPQDAVQLKKWSNALEEAIEEFEAAIKVLSRYR